MVKKSQKAPMDYDYEEDEDEERQRRGRKFGKK